MSREDEGRKSTAAHTHTHTRTDAHTHMWVRDESLLPDPRLFLELGYIGTIANHFALSLSRVAGPN